MIIDAFAGGGGASVGIEMALGRPVDIAINHDPQAREGQPGNGNFWKLYNNRCRPDRRLNVLN
jgi:site-specific DNA-cytosine methylase